MSARLYPSAYPARMSDTPTTLSEAIDHWDLELQQASAFLPEAPMDARDWARRLDLELATATDMEPTAATRLATLKCEVQILLAQSQLAAEQFLHESEERERAFEARERAMSHLPIEQIRQPYHH